MDVGHATHKDKKSQSVGIDPCGCIGQGGVQIFCKSMKQRIVTLSSTEAELVGLSELFDILLYLERLFKFLCLEELKRPYTVHQDNTSTMTIAYLGRPPSQSRRHFLDTRYFWTITWPDSSISSPRTSSDVLASVALSGHAFLHQTTVIWVNLRYLQLFCGILDYLFYLHYIYFTSFLRLSRNLYERSAFPIAGSYSGSCL